MITNAITTLLQCVYKDKLNKPRGNIAVTLTSVLEAVCCLQWLYCQHGPAWKLQKLPDIQVTSFLLPQEKKEKKETTSESSKDTDFDLFNSYLDKYSKSAQGS